MVTVLASEAWAGANNAALPSQWTAAHVSGTGSDLQNGAAGAKMTTAAASSNTERIYLSGMTATVDEELLTSFTVTGQTSCFFHIILNSTGTTSTANNAYTSQGYGMLVTVSATAASSTIRLTKTAANTITNPNAAVTTTITAGTKYNVRFQRLGSTLRYKIWTGATEPGAWSVTATDAGTVLGAGAPAFVWQTGTAVAHLVTVGTVTVYDNSSAMTDTAAFTAASTLSATPTPKPAQTAGFTASADLAATGTQTLAGFSDTAGFTASATLAATPTPKPAQTAGFSAGATLSATRTPTPAQTATFTASVNLASTATSTATTAAPFTATASLAATGTPGLSLPYTETFPGAASDPWPAPWITTAVSGAGSASQTGSGTGQLITGATSYATESATLPLASHTDIEVVTTFSFATQAESYLNIALDTGTSASVNNLAFPADGYSVLISLNATPSFAGSQLMKTVGASTSSMASVVGVTLNSGVTYSIRLQRVGTTIRYRIWLGSPEPTTWDASVTDSGTMLPSGDAAVYWQGGAANAACTATIGAFQVDSAASQALSDTAAFTAAATLAGTPTPTPAVSGAFSASATLTSTASPTPAVSAGFTTAATLSATPAAAPAASAVFTAAATLTATPTPKPATTAGLTAAAALAATRAVTTSGTAAFAPVATLASTVAVAAGETSAFTAAASLDCTASPTVTLPFFEDFSSGGSDWPLVWIPRVVAGATGGQAINMGGYGRLIPPTSYAGGYQQQEVRLNSEPFENFDIKFDLTMSAQDEAYLAVSAASDDLEATANYFLPQNGYVLSVNVYAPGQFGYPTTGSLELDKMVADTKTVLHAEAFVSGGYTPGTPYTVRFLRSGDVIRARIWETSTAEPTTWLIDAVDSGATPPPGQLHFRAGNGGDNSTFDWDFDNIAVAPMVSIPYTETFTGTDGSAWPAVWTTSSWGDNGTVEITGDAGHILAPRVNGDGYDASIAVLSMPEMGDTDVTGTIVGAYTGMEQYAEISINGTGPLGYLGYSFGDCYYLAIQYDYDGVHSNLAIYEKTDSASIEDILVSSAALPIVATTKYGFRFQRVGQTIQARIWDATVAEPSTWDASTTIVGTPKTGAIALATQSNSAAPPTGGDFTFDDIVVAVPEVGAASAAFDVSATLAASSTVAPAQTAGLTVAASLAATSTARLAQTAAFSPTATLASTRTITTSGTSAFTATAGLAAVSQPKWSAAAALTVTASLATTRTVTTSGSGAFTATATLAATPAARPAVSGAFTATATLTSTGVGTTGEVPVFTATATLASSAAITTTTTAGLSASAVLAATQLPTVFVGRNFSASATLAADATGNGQTSVSFSAAGTLAAAAVPAWDVTATFTSAATLSATPSVTQAGAAGFTVGATLSGIPTPAVAVIAAMAANADLTSTRTAAATASVGFGPDASLAADPQVAVANAAVFAAAVTLAASGLTGSGRAGAFTASATLASTGGFTPSGQPNFTASATLLSTGQVPALVVQVLLTVFAQLTATQVALPGGEWDAYVSAAIQRQVRVEAAQHYGVAAVQRAVDVTADVTAII